MMDMVFCLDDVHNIVSFRNLLDAVGSVGDRWKTVAKWKACRRERLWQRHKRCQGRFESFLSLQDVCTLVSGPFPGPSSNALPVTKWDS